MENGVGKLTASERGAPNVGMGKRAWRTPIPHLSLSDRKVGQGLIVFCEIVLVLLLVLVIENIDFEDDDENEDEDDKEQNSSCSPPKLITILTNNNN